MKVPLWNDLIDILNEGFLEKNQRQGENAKKTICIISESKWKMQKIEMQGMKCKEEWSNLTFSDVDLYTHIKLAKLLHTQDDDVPNLKSFNR